MKVTLIQMDIKWKDHVANIKTAERAILNAPKSDIYILPEMWSTGFIVHPAETAEPGREALAWMTKTAKALDAAICGSIAVNENGHFYNRCYFVTPDCTTIYYDKRHLFTYGKEHLSYTAGAKRTIIQWRGVRFLLQICYDLRFPCFARNNDDYDAIIYVASWPESRIHVWHTLLCARAIENQCYVIGVNRIGHDPTCGYNGNSEAYDAYGKCICFCKENHATAMTFNIDMNTLNAFRSKFPLLSDRDSIQIL